MNLGKTILLTKALNCSVIGYVPLTQKNYRFQILIGKGSQSTQEQRMLNF